MISRTALKDWCTLWALLPLQKSGDRCETGSWADVVVGVCECCLLVASIFIVKSEERWIIIKSKDTVGDDGSLRRKEKKAKWFSRRVENEQAMEV